MKKTLKKATARKTSKSTTSQKKVSPRATSSSTQKLKVNTKQKSTKLKKINTPKATQLKSKKIINNKNKTHTEVLTPDVTQLAADVLPSTELMPFTTPTEELEKIIPIKNEYNLDDNLNLQTDPEDLDINSTSLTPALISDQGSGLQSKDPLTTYLNEIRKYPLLTKEQEFDLAKKYFETKDPEAAQTLVRSNLRFVVKIAAEYARFSSRMIDLIQEGNIGLMHAVKEFNPYKGARLITYAVWWIRGYIQEYLMRQYSMVRIGTTAHQRKLFYQLQRQKHDLEKMISQENIRSLSETLDIPEDEVSEMALRFASRDVSLDKSNDDDNPNASLGQLLQKEDGSLPLDEQLALAEQLKFLKTAIDNIKANLNPKELIILNERVLNDEPLTLQEIGEKYKITREAVRQNEARLIQKIKNELENLMSKK